MQAPSQLTGLPFRYMDLPGGGGQFWGEFNVDPAGGSYFVDFSPFDLEPGYHVSVGYDEPDLDHVINSFTTPPHEIYLPIVRR